MLAKPLVESPPAARQARFAAWVAAGTLLLGGLTPSTYGQTSQVDATAGGVGISSAQNPAPINSESASCNQLKDTLQKAGALNIVSGQRGWAETYYGPQVPQCQFWQRPMFSYVSASDGSCGLGYICVQRVTGGG